VVVKSRLAKPAQIASKTYDRKVLGWLPRFGGLTEGESGGETQLDS
jgi:hypothetical protein